MVVDVVVLVVVLVVVDVVVLVVVEVVVLVVVEVVVLVVVEVVVLVVVDVVHAVLQGLSTVPFSAPLSHCSTGVVFCWTTPSPQKVHWLTSPGARQVPCTVGAFPPGHGGLPVVPQKLPSSHVSCGQLASLVQAPAGGSVHCPLLHGLASTIVFPQHPTVSTEKGLPAFGPVISVAVRWEKPPKYCVAAGNRRQLPVPTPVQHWSGI
jgi:hypothetical protein